MFKMNTIYKESHGAVLLLYADLFSPRVNFALLHIHNNFRTVLTLSSYRCVEREIIYDMGICRVLNSSTDYYGERAKIKRGGGGRFPFILYHVPVVYSYQNISHLL